jgi:membrane protease YdiL (CAAX protease family)
MKQKNSKIRQVVGGFLPVVAVMLLQEGVSLVGAEIAFLLSAMEFNGGGIEDFLHGLQNRIGNATFNATLLLIYSVLGVLIFGWWFYKKKSELSWRSMSLQGFDKRTLVVGIVLFVMGSQVMAAFITRALGIVFPEWLVVYEQLMQTSGFAAENPSVSLLVITILYGCILGPVTEELVFRGLSLGYMKKSGTFFSANLVQALLFAGFHLNMLQASYAFLLGLVLGLVAYRTGSVMLTILLHMAFNTSSLIFGGLFDASTRQGPMLSAVILIVAMMCVYVSIPMLITSKPIAREK